MSGRTVPGRTKCTNKRSHIRVETSKESASLKKVAQRIAADTFGKPCFVSEEACTALYSPTTCKHEPQTARQDVLSCCYLLCLQPQFRPETASSTTVAGLPMHKRNAGCSTQTGFTAQRHLVRMQRSVAYCSLENVHCVFLTPQPVLGGDARLTLLALGHLASQRKVPCRTSQSHSRSSNQQRRRSHTRAHRRGTVCTPLGCCCSSSRLLVAPFRHCTL